MTKLTLLLIAFSLYIASVQGEELVIEPETFAGQGKLYERKNTGLSNDSIYSKWETIAKKITLAAGGKYYIWVRYSGNPAPWGNDPQNIRNFAMIVNDKVYEINQFGGNLCWQVFPQYLQAGSNTIQLKKKGQDPFVDQIFITSDFASLPQNMQHLVGKNWVKDQVYGRTMIPDTTPVIIPRGKDERIVKDFISPRQSLKQQTQITACHDGVHVVFTFICEQPAESLKTGSRQVYLDDSIELLIDADRELQNVWHLIINSAGEMYSEKRSGGLYIPWQADWKYQVQINPTFWTVTIQVPIAGVMRRFPEKPGSWRVNFCRTSTNTAETSSWMKTDSFLNPRSFGEVKLVDLGQKEIEQIYRPVLTGKLAALGMDIDLTDMEIADFEFRELEKRFFRPPDGQLVYYEDMNLIPNPGFEYGILDSGQPEPLNWVKTGKGTVMLVPQPQTGKFALAISQTAPGFSLKASTRPYIDYTKAYTWEFWHKGADISGNPSLQITWYGHDDSKPGWNPLKEIGNEKYPIPSSQNWQKQTFLTSPPPGAMNCEFSIHADGSKGTLLLDHFVFDGIGAQSIDFLFPQTGYEANGHKTMLIWSRYPDLQHFQILRGRQTVLQAKLNNRNRSAWGRYCYEADFSSISEAGTYVLRINQDTSLPFTIASGTYLQLAKYASRFYYAQRQGIDVPGWHKANFLDDAGIFDRQSKTIIGHRDVSGGWQDAGDPSKQATDDYSIYGLAEFYQNLQPQWHELGEKYPDILALNWWGVKRVVEKCHLGDGTFVGLSVGFRPQPKKIHKVDPADWTDNTPGTDDDRIISGSNSIGWTVSYLAKFAVAVQSADKTLSDKIAAIVTQNHLLRREMKKGPPDYPERLKTDVNFRIARYDVEMMRTAMHLHRLTGQEEYHQEAEKYSREVTALLARVFTLPTSDPIRGNNTLHRFRWDSSGLAAALFEYLRNYPDDSGAKNIKSALKYYLDQLCKYGEKNEFGITASLEPEKTLHFDRVGRNAAICNFGYLAALGANLFKNPEYRKFAERSAQWVLGRNPTGISMLIGKGWKFAATSSTVAAYSPGHGDGIIPGVIRGIGHGDETMPAQYPSLSVAFTPGGQARSSMHEIFQLDTIMFILLCQELHKGICIE